MYIAPRWLKTQRHSDDRAKPSKTDRPVRTARTFVHHHNSTLYDSTEIVFFIFPFLKTNITSQMWPSGGGGGGSGGRSMEETRFVKRWICNLVEGRMARNPTKCRIQMLDEWYVNKGYEAMKRKTEDTTTWRRSSTRKAKVSKTCCTEYN